MSAIGANEDFVKAPDLKQLEFIPNVLLIEEDVALHQFWSLLLQKTHPKSQLTSTSTAEDAERLISNAFESSSPFDLVISNLFLKGEMTGLELWKLFSESEILFPQFIIISSVPINEYERLLSDEKRKPLFVRKPLEPNFCGNLISKTFFETYQRTQMQENLKGKF